MNNLINSFLNFKKGDYLTIEFQNEDNEYKSRTIDVVFDRINIEENNCSYIIIEHKKVRSKISLMNFVKSVYETPLTRENFNPEYFNLGRERNGFLDDNLIFSFNEKELDIKIIYDYLRDKFIVSCLTETVVFYINDIKNISEAFKLNVYYGL